MSFNAKHNSFFVVDKRGWVATASNELQRTSSTSCTCSIWYNAQD